MKSNGIAFFLAVVTLVPIATCAQDNFLQEKNLVRERIIVLKDQLKAEKDGENRKKLLQEIAKQRKIIADQASWGEKWGWSVAKAAGAVALVSLAAYNFFATPPGGLASPSNNAGNLSNNLLSKQQEKDPYLEKKELFKNRVMYSTLKKASYVSSLGSLGLWGTLLAATGELGNVALFLSRIVPLGAVGPLLVPVTLINAGLGVGSYYYSRQVPTELKTIPLPGKHPTVFDYTKRIFSEQVQEKNPTLWDY